MKTKPNEQEYAITCTNLLPIHGGSWSDIDQWQIASIAPCPNCGANRLLWAENGHVPGYRMCELCGRPWMVTSTSDRDANTVTVRLQVPNTNHGPEWQYGKPDKSDQAYERYTDRVRVHGGSPFERSTWEHYQK